MRALNPCVGTARMQPSSGRASQAVVRWPGHLPLCSTRLGREEFGRSQTLTACVSGVLHLQGANCCLGGMGRWVQRTAGSRPGQRCSVGTQLQEPPAPGARGVMRAGDVSGGSTVSKTNFGCCAPTTPAQAQPMRGEADRATRSEWGTFRGPLPFHPGSPTPRPVGASSDHPRTCFLASGGLEGRPGSDRDADSGGGRPAFGGRKASGKAHPAPRGSR